MSTDQLDATFAALADPTSKHLKVLERAGLISRGREAQRRPCRIAPDALKDVDAWLESYRALWDERLDRLEVYLREVQAKQKKGKRHGRHDR